METGSDRERPAGLRARVAERLRNEDGMAMIVAVTMLFVISVLAGVTVATAMQTNGSTRRDANKKNALEAAEAGLQVALYRLNMLRPDDSHCVGDDVGSPDSTGACASSSYTLGNGSTYRFWTTPVIGTGSSCVGLFMTSSINVSQRCVTAQGTSNGITARSQIRASAFAAEPLFPVPGITGINGITNGNNVTVNGGEATNKTITGGNSNTVITGGVSLGPGGSYTGYGDPSQDRLGQPIVLGPVDPGSSSTVNDDYRIANYLANPQTPTPPNEDPSTDTTFDPTTRILTMSGSHPSLTLGGGIYNFCEIDIKNNAIISLATNVRAEIFIDSPDDPNSGCPAGTGSLNIKNNVTWSNPLNDPTALQIYVYGWNNGQNVVNFMNNGNCTCVLYAPQSTINLSHNSNNSDLTGAVSGNIVNVPNNFLFTYNNSAGSLQARTTGLYYRSAWAQCTPTVTGTSPGAGCG